LAPGGYSPKDIPGFQAASHVLADFEK